MIMFFFCFILDKTKNFFVPAQDDIIDINNPVRKFSFAYYKLSRSINLMFQKYNHFSFWKFINLPLTVH